MHEPLPGCESEAWAKKSIAKMTALRANLTQLVAAASALGTFRVAHREYQPAVLLRQVREHCI